MLSLAEKYGIPEDDLFTCKTQRTKMLKTRCVYNQRLAAEYDSANLYARHVSDIAYARWLTCSNCSKGKEIAEELNADIQHVKPHLKLAKQKAPTVREKSVLRIDWQELLGAVNTQCGTAYRHPKTMLTALYRTRSIVGLGRFLGVSHGAVRNALVTYGVPIRKKSIKAKKGKPKSKRLPPQNVEIPVWEKALCSECGKYAAKARGLCASCYRAAKGEGRI